MPRNYMTPGGTSLKYMHAIGRGQFGTAIAVRNNKGDMYCVKEVMVGNADEELRKEATREVQMMKETCSHPNIINYHDSWFDKKCMCILMEYAPNGSLDKIIEQYAVGGRRFPEYKVMHFMQELADALRYCHDDLHIMHRDIKPANILIDQLGTAKLADFGLSKQLSAQDNFCHTQAGTPLYLSPEQCQEGTYSFPADVWALGCVMYEIMALRSPWLDDNCPHPKTYPALVMRIVNKTPDVSKLMSKYNESLVNTVKWMLQRNVAKRATARQVTELLEMRSPPTLAASFVNNAANKMAPPTKVHDITDHVVHAAPTGYRGDTLLRQEDLIREAKRLAAATIQRSFRVSTEQRRMREIMKKVCPESVQPQYTPQPLQPMDRKPLPHPQPIPPPKMKPTPPVASKMPPTTGEEQSVKVLQRAFRTSLNGRRKDRKTPQGPHIPNIPSNNNYRAPTCRVPVCTPRISQLAQPRPSARATPRRNVATPDIEFALPAINKRNQPPQNPRPAWM